MMHINALPNVHYISFEEGLTSLLEHGSRERIKKSRGNIALRLHEVIIHGFEMFKSHMLSFFTILLGKGIK